MTVKDLIEELKKYPEDKKVALEEQLAELRWVVDVSYDPTLEGKEIVILS